MICDRCDGRIHSGKIVWRGQKTFCKHCDSALKQQALKKINDLWDKLTTD